MKESRCHGTVPDLTSGRIGDTMRLYLEGSLFQNRIVNTDFMMRLSNGENPGRASEVKKAHRNILQL